MNLSLNQVFARLQTIAKKLRQINDFKIGNPIDILTEGDLKYPALLGVLLRGNNNKADKKNYYQFRFLFCDIENVAQDAKTNQKELYSDLTSIANDFKNILHSIDYVYDWEISSNSNVEYLEEQFKDQVMALQMDIEIGVWNDSGTCDLPLYNFILNENGDIIENENGTPEEWE
jgi:predicted RNA-binding protein associated with RNAse of E/G family